MTLADEKVVERLTTDEAANRRTELVRVDGYRSSYCNSVALEVSPWDFKFRFGIIAESTKETLRVDNWAEAYMSPQHAKVFLKVLQDKVAVYERVFGAIPEMETMMENAAKEAGNDNRGVRRRKEKTGG